MAHVRDVGQRLKHVIILSRNSDGPVTPSSRVVLYYRVNKFGYPAHLDNQHARWVDLNDEVLASIRAEYSPSLPASTPEDHLGINRIYFTTYSAAIRDYVFGRPTHNWARAKHAARGALRQVAWGRIRFRNEHLTFQFLQTLSTYDPDCNGSESGASDDDSDDDNDPSPVIGEHTRAPRALITQKLEVSYQAKKYKDHI